MKRPYIIDIFEKLMLFLSLFYFVFGFFTTYAWACKELDLTSNTTDVIAFWNPVAAIYGVMNLGSVAVIVFCIYVNQKQCSEELPINRENNLLFHILCTPLFFVTVVYLFWDFLNNCFICESNGSMSIFLTICEIILFVGTMSLILNVNHYRISSQSGSHIQRNSFVMMVTLIGVINYFFYHMTSQQILNFIQTASNFSIYEKFYNSENIKRKDGPISFTIVQPYLQPLVILFTCCCMAYLVTLLYKTNFPREAIERGQDDPVDDQFESEMNSRIQSEDTLLLSFDNLEKPQHFRLPPVSLLLGILFITVTILVLVIVVSLTSPEAGNDVRLNGLETFIIFPLLVYIISFVLMSIQINDMERWPKLIKSKHIVDKALLWIGSAGQLIVSLAQITVIRGQFLFGKSEPHIFLYIFIIIIYLLLIFQTLLQTITICLALDREWLPPVLETWQEKICPPVGLLSLNIGLFLISAYSVKNESSMTNFTMPDKSQLFLKIFGSGFTAIGETLAILSRLHSSLIFGKMVAFPNKCKK